ncbi:MAG: VWA domain-containing protein [Candidatus Omnitrophica bacterium]|nr:VWA domain-containing protein [Candidatus Omnitrophota bacterium]MBU1996302.1 VWA domain-containing protein [Candidatus Omnitrophota bacterium]
MRKFANEHLINNIVEGFDAGRLVFKNVLLIFVFIFCIIALARPQWGFEWREIKRKGTDILLVIDVSKSMLTQDVKPNRLERTKLAVKDLIKKLKGDRIGTIAFAGDAFLVCPLTSDYSGFMLSLNDLDVDSVPRGGTNLSVAIDEALKNHSDEKVEDKAIIIITDGDNLEGDPMAAAKRAKEAGVNIYTVGIGTKEGELIQVKNERGSFEFLKDKKGNFVKSRLNDKLLGQISLETGGVYVKASGSEFGIDLIYDRYLSSREKKELESKQEKLYYQRFQLPLLIALALLLYQTGLSSKKEVV